MFRCRRAEVFRKPVSGETGAADTDHARIVSAVPWNEVNFYMGMGSLAWRTMYQQGRLSPWGKIEWLQGTSSSG